MRNFYLIVNREKPRVEEAAGLICSLRNRAAAAFVWIAMMDFAGTQKWLRHTAIPIAGRCRRIQIV